MSEKKKFTYYPGCSSQGSASHLDLSVRAISTKLGIELSDIEDWNCCGASVGHIKTGALPNAVVSGRNLAKAREQGPADIITPCAACYLNTHGVNERIKADVRTKAEVNEALEAGGLSYGGDLKVRHICEVLVNDVGIEDRSAGRQPAEGLKVAGVGQTVRPWAGKEVTGSSTLMTSRSSSTTSPVHAVPRPCHTSRRRRVVAARCLCTAQRKPCT
jgi:heterodisulfide reductase subunit B